MSIEYQSVKESPSYIAAKARAILQQNRVPKNTHQWADYEWGKTLLASYDLYDYRAIKVLCDWVGV